ncbi:MAG TPA: branched-chain amino acid ABC transporter permease, partial [Actinomycetes bacterium]|nr:branched-chain amino acid ABC transporter permease [Actinomycetes bacterium]
MSVSALTRQRAGGFLLAVILAALGAGPFLLFTTGYSLDIARLALYLAVLAATWSFLSGVAGQFSFAHVAIAGLGGYAGAIWSAKLAGSGWIGGAGPAIVVGTTFGTVVGVLLGLLLQRLAGAYLALFTIAFAEVARLVVVAESELTGGRLSLAVRPGLPGSDTVHYYVMLVLLVANLALLYALLRARVGLNVRAMREDVAAAAAMGVNVRGHKLFALSLAAALAALAGSVYFHTADRMAPEDLDLILMSQVIAYAVIGGLESPLASALAALVLSLVLENLREVHLDANQVLLLAVAVAAIPVAIAAMMVDRAVRRSGARPLLTAALGAAPWAA